MPDFERNSADIIANLIREIALVLALLLCLRSKALHPLLIERSGHRLNRLKKRAHLLELVAIEHGRSLRGVVQIAAEDVPSREDKIIERSERNEVLHQRRAIVRALAKTDGAHLRQRAERLCIAATDRFHAGDQRGRNRAHAGDHDAKFSSVRLDARCACLRGVGIRHYKTTLLFVAIFP